MNTDEYWEMQISAAMDGELDAEQIRQLLDELVASDRHRSFYRQARELQPVIEGMDPAPAVNTRASSRPPRPWTRSRVLVATAAVLLVGLALTFELRTNAPVTRASSVDVVLEEDAGSMTDDRFLELTLELLRADERYRRLMLGVLDEVGTRGVAEEGSTPTRHPRREYRLTRYDGNDLDRAATSARGEVIGQVY